MKYYRISTSLLSPLSVQRQRQSNTSVALNYLPGSSLRGSLAAKYLRLGGSSDDMAFNCLFLKDGIRFPNLLPSGSKSTSVSTLPITALSCKLAPGFLSNGGHGIIDSLVFKAFSSINGHNVDPGYWSCKRCHGELKTETGFWNRDTENPCNYVATMLYRNHTGIDRLTGTAANSVFFTTQAIANTFTDLDTNTDFIQHLSGELFLNDEQLNCLQQVIGDDSLFVGADHTRGYGELILSLEEIPPPSFDLSKWNASFFERYRKITTKEPPEGIYFSIKLESHAVILDQFLRPDTDISFCFEGNHLELVTKIVKMAPVRGWQSSWGLPKPDDVGISMGSVFLYSYTGKNEEDLEVFLTGLMAEGIGLRREEGLGRISVCDPIHVTEVI